MNDNFNNIMNVEGLRDFFKDQIYETLYPYVIANNLNSDVNNPLYLRVRNLVKRVNNLPKIYLNKDLSSQEKNINIQQEADYISEELTQLRTEIGYGRKKTM